MLLRLESTISKCKGMILTHLFHLSTNRAGKAKKFGQNSANQVITRSKTKSDELQLIRADPFGKARCSIRFRLWQCIACTTAPEFDDG